jgi:hypothetical protein
VTEPLTEPTTGRDRWQRAVSLPWVVAALVAALVIGVLTGGGLAERGIERAAAADTRIELWSYDWAAGDLLATDVAFTAVGRTTGAAVLLHELRTPVGAVSFAQDVALAQGPARPMKVTLRPDCAKYPAWDKALRARPRTVTALVRDRPADPLREMPVDLTGQLVLSKLVGPCLVIRESPGGGNPSATPGTAVIASGMSGSSDGSLAVHFQAPAGSAVRITVDALELLRGSEPGRFRVGSSPGRPLALDPGADVQVMLRLAYHCTTGAQVLPFPSEIIAVQAVDAATGRPVDVVGWDDVAVGRAVLGALRVAGCPDSTENATGAVS